MIKIRKEFVEITFYIPSISGSPLNCLWNTGCGVSKGFKFFGLRFIKYDKFFKRRLVN